jgi:hypothetical protein
MRLLLVACTLSIAAPAAAVAVQASPDQKPTALNPAANCPRTTSVYAWQRGKTVKPQKLTELPDANAYSAVLRRIGRCEVPVVVRYGVSSGR